ncbi:MG(2+) CHELATASE FAMILY PROTEIN / ComM-related protein [Paramagnetospirillum magnetotacticum MS-1]|uniref:MG(2+) CHELATASE FAMILY PROTEIN / ComM-related protein n=1 Tax=Paramagnetospirillum magnetotacticum MS-1 TaxID=272627 RepID=A0A0C2YT59_PARME|nr:YifB family Mg chelatase-like AAA ATPase [Paramagnetospirillum magnetotacticum]KIL97905.1 MG(2+) CHELATASE FAMILY PROTEIN / ComM-related protein [Paramagnetospirillum magnetotacticum MS-1]
MTTRTNTVAFSGIDCLDIDVQVQVAAGLPAFTLVGLPDKAVGESRERVRAAFNAIGLALPPKRITVNLAPADLLKEGSHFDLPIALGLLGAMGVLPADELMGYVALGELGLDGSIAPVAGVLPAAIAANASDRGLICPQSQGSEAAWAGEVEVLAAPSLLGLINHFKGSQILARPAPRRMEDEGKLLDLMDIKGQESAKRALEVAAAGAHNLLMMGPPGSGKSMLAARLPGLLPPLEPAEALEVSMIHSVAGQLAEGRLLTRRPFRDPHHSASVPSLVGGGLRARPGEVSLAHNGVLFLDELPEFQRGALEALRQPLESGRAVVARANAHVTYPARIQLVAAMNPCRCGHLGDPALACNKAPKCGQDYQSKISGPLFDRIDLHVEVPAVSPADLSLPPPAEGSAEVAARVAAARALQLDRYRDTNIRTNAEADGELLMQVASPDEAGRRLLTEAAERMRLSARGWHRVLRVARTLADLQGVETIGRLQVAEALSYRRLMPGRPG